MQNSKQALLLFTDDFSMIPASTCKAGIFARCNKSSITYNFKTKTSISYNSKTSYLISNFKQDKINIRIRLSNDNSLIVKITITIIM